MQIARPVTLIGKNRQHFAVKPSGIALFLRHLSFVLRHSLGLIAQSASKEKLRPET
jgi:hypothetical protein